MVALDGRRPPTTDFARVMLYSHQELPFTLALVRRICADNVYWIPGCPSLLVHHPYGKHKACYVHHADHEDVPAHRQMIPLERHAPLLSPTGKFVIDIRRRSSPSRYMIFDMQTSQQVWGPYLEGYDPRQILHITQGTPVNGSLRISGAHEIRA